MRVPTQISDYASRADGSSISIILRLGSLSLSAMGFICGIVEVAIASYYWYIFTNSIFIVWTLGYFALLFRRVKIAPPIMITSDLLHWGSALTFIALGWLFSAGYNPNLCIINNKDTWPCPALRNVTNAWITNQVFMALLA